MVISWYGEGCYKIQEGDFVMMTDPLTGKSGLSQPRFRANVLVKTLAAFPPEEEAGDAFAISAAGEYDTAGVAVQGFPLPGESGGKFLKTIYIADMSGIRLCLLGHISEMPDAAIFERLINIDILFVPAGGDPFLDQKSVVKIIRDLEPKVVIPGFYKIPGLARNAEDIKKFTEIMNHGKSEAEEKFTVKRKELAEIKGTKLILLKV